MKPIAYDISQWDTRTEIFYKCPTCSTSLKLLGNKAKFCYQCGCEIEWKDIPLHVTEKISNRYHSLNAEEQYIMMKRINANV